MQQKLAFNAFEGMKMIFSLYALTPRSWIWPAQEYDQLDALELPPAQPPQTVE